MKTSLVVAWLLLLSGDVWAQNCGGVVNVNGVCIPPDQGSSPLNDSYGSQGDYDAPVMSRIKWVDSWGAIASDGQGTMGIVTDMPSKRKAKKAAIGECLSRGGGACAGKTEYRNQCAAVVAGDAQSNIVNAETIEKAIEIGMQSCRGRKDVNCHIYWSGCSLPERIQ